MSDLISGGMSSHARGDNNDHPRAPAATGSPQIRGPRDIMRERTAREARRRAEQEKEERTKAEEDARLLERDRERQAERNVAAGAAAQRIERSNTTSAGAQRVPSSGRHGDRAVSAGHVGPSEQPTQRRSTSARGPDLGPEVAPLRLNTQQPTKPVDAGVADQGEKERARRPAASSTALPNAPPPPAAAAASSRDPTRSSFPHAFERWETLSAHWEGLTAFWLRRLEENSREIDRDPLSQQLARQNTDLSAAGANLFHAVVELQRLRASSERKFQRWFFDTRHETERLSEINGVLEQQLRDERTSRQAAIDAAVAAERVNKQNDKKWAETKRELDIAKAESRRAWEELGRREQLERQKTNSLRSGHPILVGGIQVVPMVQGVPSRHGSIAARDVPPTRQGPSEGEEYGEEPDSPGQDSDETYQEYSRNQRAEPADPFVENPRQRRAATSTAAERAPVQATAPAFTQAPAVQPASPGTPQGRPLHPSTQSGQAEGPDHRGTLSEDEYEIDSQGQFVRDASGNKVRYESVVSDSDTEEYEHSPRRYREHGVRAPPVHVPMSGVEYGQGPTTTTAGSSSSQSTSPPTAPVDYSGDGYGGAAGANTGAGAGWEAFPRHHHPTRLSDVLEEDERSRTSASLISGRP